MKDLVTIGKITKSQGNKGEVRIFPLTDFLDRFQILDKVYLEKDTQLLEKEIENVRLQKNMVIIKFAGVDNIEQAQAFRDYYLKIPKTELMELPQDHYYIEEIMDFKVVTNTGNYLGKVFNVISTGGTDILEIKGETKNYMVPTAHEIIKEIKMLEKEIVIEPIPGLLEL